MKRLIIALILAFPLNCFALEIGVITDMHAGSQSKRKTDISTVYPKKAVSYFEKALKQMRDKVDLVIVLGDNTNDNKKKYYKKLKKIENKYKIKTLWVKGNHDGRYFNYLSNKENYFYDIEDTRIIVLDTNHANKNGNGRITPEGLELYQEASKTDKKVIVAMHHPPYHKLSDCIWNPEYDWAKDADMILSGHWHKKISCENTQIFKALTEKKKLNYEIIEF